MTKINPKEFNVNNFFNSEKWKSLLYEDKSNGRITVLGHNAKAFILRVANAISRKVSGRKTPDDDQKQILGKNLLFEDEVGISPKNAPQALKEKKKIWIDNEWLENKFNKKITELENYILNAEKVDKEKINDDRDAEIALNQTFITSTARDYLGELKKFIPYLAKGKSSPIKFTNELNSKIEKIENQIIALEHINDPNLEHINDPNYERQSRTNFSENNLENNKNNLFDTVPYNFYTGNVVSHVKTTNFLNKPLNQDLNSKPNISHKVKIKAPISVDNSELIILNNELNKKLSKLQKFLETKKEHFKGNECWKSLIDFINTKPSFDGMTLIDINKFLKTVLELKENFIQKGSEIEAGTLNSMEDQNIESVEDEIKQFETALQEYNFDYIVLMDG